MAGCGKEVEPCKGRISVLHLRASNFIGGPEKQLLEHLSRVDRTRFRPVICCFQGEGEEDPLLAEARSLGIEALTVESGSSFDLRTVSRLSRLLKETGVDIICTHGYKPNIIGRLSSWGAGIPTIAVSRGWTAENFRVRLYEAADKAFLHMCDHVVAVSGGQREKILKLGLSDTKVSVIHNAINLESHALARPGTLRNEFGFPDGSVVIASAGRLSPEKNYAAMIETARLVCSRYEEARFVIFGEGFLRGDLEQRISDAGLKGRFLLPGFRRDVLSLLSEIDIFMLPSFSEGLPNVALESFAYGKPIVASAVGGTPEVVQDGVSGYLTSPKDVQSMTAGVVRLLIDKGQRDLMGSAGYRHVRDNFSFDTQTASYERLYTEMLRKAGRRK